jgi:Flp pilus assembly pilin Flp
MVRNLASRLVKDERGQDLLEYALLGGLIAVSLMAAALFLVEPLRSMANGIGNCIDFNESSICSPF